MNTDINDIRKTCYPSVTVDLNKLYDNTKLVTDACRKDGITVAGIVKGCNGRLHSAGHIENGSDHRYEKPRYGRCGISSRQDTDALRG